MTLVPAQSGLDWTAKLAEADGIVREDNLGF